ncbi:hypothetical protein ACU635_43835 [[Actinomadura] parvosata]|uniref:hypothetical protein n=1 Tax=[Actinomadura] parvosata TaxID=1955412 RepID=UPI00406C2026
MATPAYAHGKKLHLTINGVTIIGMIRDGADTLAYLRLGNREIGPLPLADARVVLKPVDPPNWPPQPGDTWEADAYSWFALAIHDERGTVVGVRLVNNDDRCPHGLYGGDPYCYEDADVLLSNSPEEPKLIHRRGQAPPPVRGETHPDFTDEPPF